MRSQAMRPNSIRARMTAGFAFFIAVLMLAMCAAFFIYTKRADRHDADARLTSTAASIQQELKGGHHSLDKAAEFIAEEEDDLRAANVALIIVDRQNRVVAQSQRHVPSWPPRSDAWRIVSMEFGARRVVIGVPWHETEEDLRERTAFLLGLSAFVVAFSALGAWVLVGRTLSPIDHLARQAQAASTESLRVRLESPSPDAEIARLVTTLNDLLARLEDTAAARGRFYASASHELRTPLQALTGHLEVALSRPRDVAAYQEALGEGHAQAERLTTLVQDLLLLNQLDAGTSHPVVTLLDVADICETELSNLRALIEARDLTIHRNLPDACEINAPWTHVSMLTRNLLENAVKYATSGGAVRVRLDQSTLTIQNDCAPVIGWDADRYFEPFFRPDASRSSETGGNGLGLTICKAICESNGWDITLSQEQDGISVSVRFARLT